MTVAELLRNLVESGNPVYASVENIARANSRHNSRDPSRVVDIGREETCISIEYVRVLRKIIYMNGCITEGLEHLLMNRRYTEGSAPLDRYQRVTNAGCTSLYWQLNLSHYRYPHAH